MRRLFLNKFKKIHILGIGGMGMSGLARIFNDYGMEVTGSDLKRSSVTNSLENLGIKINYEHAPNNIIGKDLVVYSSAVKPENPEIIEANKRNIPIIKRDKALGEISLIGNCIAIAGSHGKTTTSGMIGKILLDSGLDPTILIGGDLPFLNDANARLGKGNFVVLEADEYDRAFLSITHDLALITNIEAEHLDIYKNFNGVKQAFENFANKTSFYGSVFVDYSDEGCREILKTIDRNVVTYGLEEDANVKAFEIKNEKDAVYFKVNYLNEYLGEFKIKLHGRHNVKNAVGAIALARYIGLEAGAIKKSIGEFVGALRRFQILTTGKPVIIDDYAHHPTEVRATLKAAKNLEGERLVAIFQPHLFSRTKLFYKEFSRALTLADLVILLEIYPAREKPQKGVSSELIFNELKAMNFQNVLYLKEKNNLVQKLNNLIMTNDVVVGMGAGNITTIINELAKNFNGIKSEA